MARSTATSVNYSELLRIPARAYHQVAEKYEDIGEFVAPVLQKEASRRRAKLRWKKACAQVITMRGVLPTLARRNSQAGSGEKRRSAPILRRPTIGGLKMLAGGALVPA